MMKAGFLNVDWKSEPTLREKALFAIVPFLLLIPCIRVLWLPIEDAVGKSRADLKLIAMQVETIKKVLDMTAREAQAAAANIPEENKTGGRGVRVLSRQAIDKNQEVAAVVSALSSRELASNVDVKNILVGKETAFPNYSAIPIDVILEGGYAAVERYLKAVEEIERPFLVRGIGISKGKGVGGKLDARITLWVYFAGGAAKK